VSSHDISLAVGDGYMEMNKGYAIVGPKGYIAIACYNFVGGIEIEFPVGPDLLIEKRESRPPERPHHLDHSGLYLLIRGEFVQFPHQV
jgi:hypothetical protein